jgi:peptidoglycan hydrolase-like protein with peptidoglycan-binding domain
MKIADFVSQDLKYDTTAIAADAELSQELQALLIDLGFLTAPPDQSFGVRATAALTRFQQKNGCVEPEFLGAQTAAKLVEASEMGSRSPLPPMITVEAVETTALKLRPLDSSALAANEKQTLRAGEKLEAIFFTSERKHIKIVLSQALQGSEVWYVFADHVKIYGGEEPVLPPPPPDEKPAVVVSGIPGQVKLAIPYKSQQNNSLNPDGSCNVTCMAMCLEFLKLSRRQLNGQLEDELYQYMLDQGWSRHSPYDLAKLVRAYDAKDAFDSHATVSAVKDWLAAGNPAVTHGWFTGSGHIITLTGYDDGGFIVHDPNGEWYASGYDRNTPSVNDEKGKFQHYSYKLIQETCQTDGEFWVHFISK